MLSIKIAWRNLFRHRGKSMVIGAILFLGAFLLTLGNSVISGMEKGLDKSVVGGFTGDVILISKEQQDPVVLLNMGGKPVKDILRFDTLRPKLESAGLFKNILPVGKGFALALNEQDGVPGFAFLLGVNFRQWKEMFPESMRIMQGNYPDSTGLLMSTGGLDQLYSTMGIWFQPKGFPIDTALLGKDAKEAYPHLTMQNDIVFMGFNEANSTSDIRLPLDGISKFKALNKIWGHFLFVDIASYRRCMGYFSEADQSASLSATQKSLLASDNDNLDALFGTEPPTPAALGPDQTIIAPKQILTTTLPEEAGAYQLVLTRFLPSVDRSQGLDSLQRFLETSGIPLQAVTWQKASGVVGSMTIIIKIALNVFVFLLFFVAIIIIVNTLSMAAMERTSEIGMMRAVGAQKSFITKMFLLETGFLSVVFGGLGILIGVATVLVVRWWGLTTENDILQLLYGGDTFKPLFGIADLILTVIQLTLVTFLASIYPVRVAKSITPLDAISRD
jgi:putative ABC transport system permease protein